MKKTRIALIGAGSIAKTHIEAYKDVPEAEIVAICDINEEKLNKVADKYGILKRFTSVDEMLKNVEADAADVCVWNCNHAECAIKALNAGLHAISEKPMAYNAEQAIKMKEAAEKNNKIMMIAFVMRFGGESLVIKDFTDQGAFGDIYLTKAHYTRRHGNPGGWFSDKSRSGGGPIIDLGVHVIDYNRYIMGNPNPTSVYAVSFKKFDKRDNLKTDVFWHPEDINPDDPCDCEDHALAIIRFDNGSVMQLEASYDMHGEGCTQNDIYGTKGGAVRGEKTGLKIYTEMNNYMVDVTPDIKDLKGAPKDGFAPAFTAELQHFVDCINGRCECRCPADDGIAVMKILDAIYESAETGKEVIIK